MLLQSFEKFAPHEGKKNTKIIEFFFERIHTACYNRITKKKQEHAEEQANEAPHNSSTKEANR